MARQPVQFTGGTVPLRPVASPVDTYEAPGQSSLRGFAEALSKIDRPLQEFLDARSQKQAEEDKLRGEQAFYAKNNDALAEGVRTGNVPAQYSPQFVAGYKQAQGNELGNNLMLSFDQAFDAWDGKNSDDPAVFDAFLQDYIKKNVGDQTDPAVLATLLPHVRAVTDHATARYTEYRHVATYQGSLGAHLAAANQAITAGDQEGKGRPEGTEYSRVFDSIEKERERFVSSGGRPEDFDKGMVDAMSVKIIQTRDPGLLAWFDRKVPGKDYTYGDTAYGAQVKQETINSLEVIGRRYEADEAEKQRKADAAAKNAAEAQIIQTLIKDPSKPVPEELVAAYEKYEGTARVKVEEWRNSLSRGYTDPDALKQVYSDIIAGGGYKAVTDAASRNVFGRPEDLTSAYNFAKGFEDNKDRMKETLGGQAARNIEQAIDVRTKGQNPLTGDPIVGMSNEGLEATYDFRRMVMQWVIANPNATPLETEEQVNKIGKAIMDRFGDAGGIGGAMGKPGGQPYNRPDSAPFDNPYSTGGGRQSNGQTNGGATGGQPAGAAGGGGTAAPGSPAGAAVGDNASSTAAPPSPNPATPESQLAAKEEQDFWNGLSEGQRKILTDQAAREGKPLDALVKELLDPAPGAPTPEAPTPWFTIPGIGLSVGPYTGPGSKYYPYNSPKEQPAVSGPRSDAQQPSAPDGTPIQLASYEQGAGGRYFPQQQQQEGLTVSAARGSTPDIEHLRPALRSGVARLQQAWGRDLPIVSGYRDAGRNARAGGAKHSQHIHGNAVDIDVRDLPTKERVRLIKLASSQGFTGIGVYANSLHLDYGGRRAWGPSFHGDSVPSWARGAIQAHLAGKGGGVPDNWTPPEFTSKVAMDLLDEALASAPLDTQWQGSAKIEGDDTATRLANLIKQHEAAGNYNAVYGKPNSTIDLSKFSLDAILRQQVAARRGGASSTAIGAYQFLYDTLVGLKRELGLTGSEKFTPQLQDRLFMALLQRRGYDAWKAGKKSNRAFALALSQEWATIANPYTGMSYYAGDGTHGRAPIKSAQVYKALGLSI